MSRTYHINKVVGKPVEFKGLVGRYIWWAGGIISILLLVFALLYITDVPLSICLILVLAIGTVSMIVTVRFGKQYGEHGWMKKSARKYIPKHIKGCLIE
jgi:hypothetical protein